MKKNFFKDEKERLLWIKLNAERIQYSAKILNHQDLELGELGQPFSCMQISENQLAYDETKSDALRFTFEELVLPHPELFRLAENKSKKRLAEMFGTELGKIADELL
jgi:hypothetical protein